MDTGSTPRSERSNATLADVRGHERPQTLDEALRDALSGSGRLAVVVVDLDTGKSRTAFVI